jgi:hypothetical protein
MLGRSSDRRRRYLAAPGKRQPESIRSTQAPDCVAPRCLRRPRVISRVREARLGDLVTHLSGKRPSEPVYTSPRRRGTKCRNRVTAPTTRAPSVDSCAREGSSAPSQAAPRAHRSPGVRVGGTYRGTTYPGASQRRFKVRCRFPLARRAHVSFGGDETLAPRKESLPSKYMGAPNRGQIGSCRSFER